nr:immunoglobulin heavy chain junction region [Macaca mulatta]MOV39378.1 immunoglobulin heavy chain junction region [Macaca mulatta]MOV39696.1 immunoglobulin heavy chain junction region [Macaca mulatta]MOV41202.1 immunoglobulin heavy chain junction region [Macaca mulatta]MOV44266.1 immunoglobulin heavy chain junction region [Macaca mulatta]
CAKHRQSCSGSGCFGGHNRFDVW